MRLPTALVLAATAALMLTACGGDDDSSTPSESPTATEASPSPTASSPAPDTPSPTPSGSETAALEQPAVWPAADVVFGSPEEAASDFVVNALGVPASLGDFQSGDARSGEIPVFFAGEGDGGSPVQRGLLLLRQLGPDDGWFVTAAVNDVVTVATPEHASSVTAGVLTVEGVARGFEGTVIVTAFPAGDATVALDQEVTMGGSLETPEPYSVTLDVSGASPGETVTILVHGGTGHEDDPGDFAAIAVTVES